MTRGTPRIIFSGLLLLAVMVSVTAGYSIGVDVEELKTGRQVEFVNFPGQSTDLLSIDQVRGIGQALSQNLKQQGMTQAQYENKYTVIHAYTAEEKDKLGADILVLSPYVAIFHIDWIRHILTGFLMSHYAYSLEDAKTVAVFITYYNAVHRGEMAYFSAHYQTVVGNNINSTNAGLALNWEEWAGRTRLLIPLTENAGRQSIGSIDTSIISDEKVVDELRKTDDRGVEDRTRLVDVKEKSLAEDKAALEKDKADQAKDKEELKKTTEEIAKDNQEIAKAEQDLAKDKKDLAKITDETAKKEKEAEIAAKEEELAAKKEELAKKEETAKAKEDEIAGQDKNITTADKKIADKSTEIEQDKAAIEKDKKITEVKENPEKFVAEMEDLKAKTVKTEPVIANTLYYLNVKEYLTDGHYNNELYAIDVKTGQALTRAAKTKICGHEYFVIPEGILVITHTDTHKGHFLTLLDTGTLEPKLTGTDLIFHRSFIQFRGDYIYAVVWDGKKSYYLGKFDKQLKKITQSTEKIDDNTVFHLFGELIYVNTPDKKILVLNEKDLSKQSILGF